MFYSDYEPILLDQLVECEKIQANHQQLSKLSSSCVIWMVEKK